MGIEAAGPNVVSQTGAGGGSTLWGETALPAGKGTCHKGNGNPQFLIRSVLDMDIQAEDDPDQAEWIDLSPLVMMGLCLLIALRFIGQGLSDRNLVIMGEWDRTWQVTKEGNNR